MNKVLVTGGAGYIGSHACKALADSGYLPVTFDNLSRGHRDFVRWGPLELGDLEDPTRLDAVFDTHRPLAVMHFAALALVEESTVDPEPYFRTNIVGSLNLLSAMRRANTSKIVFSSSCATYGAALSATIDEAHPQAPINPYGTSKLAVEGMLKGCSAAYGVSAVALRYFNAAGADAGGQIGERHDPETHLIPRLLNLAAGTVDSGMCIHGDDYPTRDGTCVRDYVHVSDIADAHVRALRFLEQGAAGFHAFNLGSAEGHSVREVISSVERVTGRRLGIPVGPRRAGDPHALVARAELAERELGWSPRVRGIDEIVASAWRWHSRSMHARVGEEA